MNFLAPLFLLGGLAIALPVVFHLIRQTARERVPFSALMFLQRSPPRLTRRSKIEHWLLLVLRCLVLCLLALGFARPLLERRLPTAPPVETRQRLVMLLDTSASMRRAGLWNEALEQARKVLEQATPGDQVAVLTFDRTVRTLVGFAEWGALNPAERAAVVHQRLSAVEPGWFNTHLGLAFTRAAETLVQSEDRLGAVLKIVAISDFQEGARLDGLQGFEWPRRLEVAAVPVKAKRPTNAGVHGLAGTEGPAWANHEGALRVLVANSSESTRDQFQLRWAQDPDPKPVNVYVPPGQSRVVLVPPPEGKAAAPRLILSGDDEDFDNVFHWTTTVREPWTFLFLGQERADDASQQLYFLQRAFPASSNSLFQVVTCPPGEPLPAQATARHTLWVVSDVLPEVHVAAARTFLENGGHLLLVLKTAEGAASLGRLLGTPTVQAPEAPVRDYAMLASIDFQDELFRPFNDPRYNDFTGIRVWKHRRLETNSLPGAQVLASFDSRDPAWIAIPHGKGRVLVATFGWHPRDSQLALSSKFVPLLLSALGDASALAPPPTQLRAGDELDLTQLAGGVEGGARAVRKPDGTVVPVPAGAHAFSQTDLPGLYTVTPREPPVTFAVNLDPAESKTGTLPLDQLERLGLPLKGPTAAPAWNLERQRQWTRVELENRQKLWRWLLVAALMVLVMETWLAARLLRAPAQTSSLT